MAYGVLALARPTFDVPYAEEMAAKAFARIDEAGLKTIGPRGLLFDAAAAREAAEALKGRKLDGLLLLQVTFTDASMTLELAKAIDAPLAIWAFPEPRSGGRLRLNSFCGLNLASHALGRAGVPMAYLYQSPDMALPAGGIAAFAASPAPAVGAFDGASVSASDQARASAALSGLKGRRIGLVGEHPAGFDTCRFDEAELTSLAGIAIDRIALGDLFRRSAAAPADAVAARRGEVAGLKGIGEVDQAQLAKSLSLFEGLASLKDERALGLRCPLLARDVHRVRLRDLRADGHDEPGRHARRLRGGRLWRRHGLMLQEIAGEPSWLVDIVDMDAQENTSVFWHCGSAPEAMRDPATPAEAQIHSNRRMPLLYQFPLKPGRITIARLSQANNRPHLMVAGGEVLQAPISFTGTSGVVRFDAPAERALQGLIGQGYEHHVAMVYGDHLGAVAALGQALGLPVRPLA